MATPDISPQQTNQAEEAVELTASRLLEKGLSVRAVAESTGLSRRQVTKLKANSNREDSDPFAEAIHSVISQKQAVSMTLALSVRPEGVKRSELGPVLRTCLRSSE